MRRRLAFSSFVALLFCVPLVASAQTATLADLQTQLGNLLAQIAALEAAQATSTTATSGSPSCVTLTQDLYAGLSDAGTSGEVSKLQAFLGISPTTGYFGPITQQGVQAWQSSHNIVLSGTPDTTGYGFVGPQTRAAMSCGAVSTSEGAGTTAAAASTTSSSTAGIMVVGNCSAVGSSCSIPVRWTTVTAGSSSGGSFAINVYTTQKYNSASGKVSSISPDYSVRSSSPSGSTTFFLPPGSYEFVFLSYAADGTATTLQTQQASEVLPAVLVQGQSNDGGEGGGNGGGNGNNGGNGPENAGAGMGSGPGAGDVGPGGSSDNGSGTDSGNGGADSSGDNGGSSGGSDAAGGET